MASVELSPTWWVVDTCLIIDVLDDDPTFAETSAQLIDAHLEDGLTICPMTYAELAPAFEGNRSLQEEFLRGIGVTFEHDWLFDDTIRSHAAWHAHIRRRRSSRGPKRPLADILIGSWSTRFQGLLTRNPSDFSKEFPDLTLLTPQAPAV